MFIKNTKFRCPANFERYKLLNDDTKEDAIASRLQQPVSFDFWTKKLIQPSCLKSNPIAHEFLECNDTTIRNVPEEEIDKLEKDENVLKNLFFYVYDVDDRETFEKYAQIHRKLNEKFNDENPKFKPEFVLYGINVNIENERRVSYEELMTTAFKNRSCYFELQEFDIEKIQKQLNDSKPLNRTIYFTGLDESGYKEFYIEYLKESFNAGEIRDEFFIPAKIGEMAPLEEILDTSISENKETGIYFVYSPFDRKTLTAIEEYFSKCTNLENYYNIPLYLKENELIDCGDKSKGWKRHRPNLGHITTNSNYE